MKKKTTTKRRKRALSEPGKRRTRRSKRSFLSDLTNPTMAANSFKNTLMAAAGGFGANIVNKNILPSTFGKPGKIGAAILGGFLLQNFGFSSIGAGFTGGMFAIATEGGLLGEEGTEFAEDTVLSAEMPLYLDEAGTPMVLEEDGGIEYFRPMTEEETLSAGY
jgi:hypothetical protein